MDASVPLLEGAVGVSWYRALRWWALGFMLLCVPAFIISLVAVTGPRSCSAADPSICGPQADVTALFALAILFMACLLWRVLLACVLGVAVGVLALVRPVADAGLSRNLLVTAGVLSALLGLGIVAGQRRQAAVARRVSAGSTAVLPAPAAADPKAGAGGAVSSGFEPGPPRLLIAAALVVVAGTLAGFYGREQANADRRAALAVRETATVVEILDNEIVVILPGVAEPQVVPVINAGRDYEAWQDVPVLLEGHGASLTVRPVAEPTNQTPWLAAALAALVVAATLAVRDLRVRAARRRLLRRPAPAVRVWAEPAGNGLLELRPCWPTRWPPAKVPVVIARRADRSVPEDPPSGRHPHSEQGEDWARWTDAVLSGEHEGVVVVTVIGDLRDGGYVGLTDDDHVFMPRGPVVGHPSATWQDWLTSKGLG